MQNFKISEAHILDIAEGLEKKKISDYVTLGELATDIRSLVGIKGQPQMAPDKEDELTKRIIELEQKNAKLVEENEKLKSTEE